MARTARFMPRKPLTVDEEKEEEEEEEKEDRRADLDLDDDVLVILDDERCDDNCQSDDGAVEVVYDNKEEVRKKMKEIKDALLS